MPPSTRVINWAWIQQSARGTPNAWRSKSGVETTSSSNDRYHIPTLGVHRDWRSCLFSSASDQGWRLEDSRQTTPSPGTTEIRSWLDDHSQRRKVLQTLELNMARERRVGKGNTKHPVYRPGEMSQDLERCQEVDWPSIWYVNTLEAKAVGRNPHAEIFCPVSLDGLGLI